MIAYNTNDGDPNEGKSLHVRRTAHSEDDPYVVRLRTEWMQGACYCCCRTPGGRIQTIIDYGKIIFICSAYFTVRGGVQPMYQS